MARIKRDQEARDQEALNQEALKKVKLAWETMEDSCKRFSQAFPVDRVAMMQIHQAVCTSHAGIDVVKSYLEMYNYIYGDEGATEMETDADGEGDEINAEKGRDGGKTQTGKVSRTIVVPTDRVSRPGAKRGPSPRTPTSGPAKVVKKSPIKFNKGSPIDRIKRGMSGTG